MVIENKRNINTNEDVINVDVLIMGAGISGIFLGLSLEEKGENNFYILEKEDRAGGLCRSFKIGNLYYDIGAHALHMKAIEAPGRLQKIIDIKRIYCQKRNAKVFVFSKKMPHPFQMHLFYAPFKVRLKCLISYLARPRIKADNLYDWLQATFGEKVCKYFLFPYNEKVWNIDLRHISTNWVSRVSSGPFKFLRGLLFAGKKNYSSNEYVCYPSNGGFEELFVGAIKSLDSELKLNSEIMEVDLDKKLVFTEDNKIYHYKKLVSTLPVDLFIRKIAKIDDEKIIDAVGRLKKVSTCLVTFLVKKNLTDIQRVYIPDKKYFAQRVIINSNSSSSFRQEDSSLISLEISYREKGDLPLSQEIIENCKRLLKDLELIKMDSDIKQSKIDMFDYVYPVQILDLVSVINEIRRYLESFDCFTIGRFGSWNYANVDGILDEVNDLVKNNF